MKQILVTGANGFISRALIEKLLQSGYGVRGAVRAVYQDAALPLDTLAVGDIGWRTDWHEVLTDIDVVVHLAARAHVLKEQVSDPLVEFRRVNVGGTHSLVNQAVTAGVERFIYISSIGVLGNRTPGRPFKEEDPPMPCTHYARSKWEAEQVLQEVAKNKGLEVIIIRPPLVYGPGNPGNFLRLIDWLDRGLPLPLANIQNCRSLVCVDNLVDFLICCIEAPRAANNVFHVTDGHDLSTPDIIRQIAHALGRPARLFPFPSTLLRFGASLTGMSNVVCRLMDSLTIDIGKARLMLGWTPPVSVDMGVGRAVRWYKETCSKKRGSR